MVIKLVLCVMVMNMMVMVCTPGKWRLHVSSVEQAQAVERKGADGYCNDDDHRDRDHNRDDDDHADHDHHSIILVRFS